jgi:hypothetical protein
MKTQTIKRTIAANVLDGILQDLASFDDIRSDPKLNDNIGDKAIAVLGNIESKLIEAGFITSELCNGEAHSNPNIDNCMKCLGCHWGYVGLKVKIR